MGLTGTPPPMGHMHTAGKVCGPYGTHRDPPPILFPIPQQLKNNLQYKINYCLYYYF